MVPRALGGPALILNLVYVTGGLGGNLRGPGARAYMNFMKAGCIDQAIFIAAVAAILDLLHYPPPGAEPGSGISGQSLVGFPRTLAFG